MAPWGDDEADRLKRGSEEAEGQAYLEAQGYLKELTQMGVVLSADSRNERENALAGLKHPDGVLDRSGYSEGTVLSEDDLKRSAMYRENAKRQELKGHFTDYREYLRSLEMEAVLRPFEGLYLARIAQLTNKSNQFTTIRRRRTGW